MLRDIGLGVEITVMVSQMNFMMTLVRRQGSTPEIHNLATRITQSSEVSRNQVWVRRIVQQRILNKAAELNNVKAKWRRASAWIREHLPGPEHWTYTQIKRGELNNIWNLEKRLKKRKLQSMAGRILKASIEGIPLGDEDLLREFGEPELNGLIIEAAENVQEFLKLDPKFKVYQELDRLEFDKEVETTSYKQRISRLEDGGRTVSQAARVRHRAGLQ